ncbi:conserved protein of unknown function [Modestobacter italicus]|uniref:Uncharacterized protein n=1 Tax=Modestobacter italicus (strain DSM 44449 / CECT 9708 / BC 501) TaxID=2732864 RepID=I4ESA1_MODI5|nr:hypothetical protein [Modestobacter marinus]CCH86264.1 conserved protein of unknown function [Modestobacter marinus]
MGVEFRLGGGDHKVAEDFLAHQAAGVSAIVVDTKAAKHQQAAAEAAADAGVKVYFDPATERLADVGFELPGLAYYPPTPYDVDKLAQQPAQRTALVAGVLAAHPRFVTTVTPPHFFVRDERSANLNVSLAEETLHEHGADVRATLVLSSRYPVAAAAELAAEYRRAGIRDMELRISPLGGEDESVRKIRSSFALLRAFTDSALTVTLGLSGNVGQTAMALGHAQHYSVGIGLRERVNHAGTISRQKQPPKPPKDGEEDGGGGPIAGIYLPGPALTVSRKLGASYLANTDIRTRVGCRLGACGTSVSGPKNDPRGHYLHARATEVDKLMSTPERWRPGMEVDRLTRARDLRRLINDKHRGPEDPVLNIRTLSSLLEDIAIEREQKTA